MAEGLINHYLADSWEAYSAGTEPSGYVHPMAIQTMAELGVDISNNSSESVEKYRELAPHVVITVCGSAAENCPVWLGEGQVTHIGFPDPADATGPDQEKLAVFQQVRDDIKEQVLDYLESGQVTQNT